MSFLSSSIFQYFASTLCVVGLVLLILHFSTQGRIWKTFSQDDYKCGMSQILSADSTPNLTGIYPTRKLAEESVLKCNSPQAFRFDQELCTLEKGAYKCQ